MAIKSAQIKLFHDKFTANPENIVKMNGVTKNGISNSAVDALAARRIPNVFSDEVKGGEITNQRSSGRCWMFASLNTARVSVMANTNVKTFEFSETYPFFWDKFEKSNYFLESILKTLDEPTNSRLVQHLLVAPIQDGGQWDMFKGILEKYGAVPKYVMQETASSMASAPFDSLLTKKLRSDACILREQYSAGADKASVRSIKEEMLYDIYAFLCISLGTPPMQFDYEYRDSNNVFHRDENITPQDFFKKYVGWNLKDKISLINAPTQDKPYGRAYTVKYLGSVVEADPICYINAPIDVLKQAAIASLQDGNPVWFGCDVGQSHAKDLGIMDVDAMNYSDLFATDFTLDKAQRLDYGDSMLTHAMVFVGVNLDDQGKPTRWKVENSWGKDRGGNDGYYVMSDAWFDQYNYQVMVDKKYIPADVLKALDQPIIELEPWDPMGALALVK